MRQLKITVEKHEDGHVAYPSGPPPSTLAWKVTPIRYPNRPALKGGPGSITHGDVRCS